MQPRGRKRNLSRYKSLALASRLLKQGVPASAALRRAKISRGAFERALRSVRLSEGHPRGLFLRYDQCGRKRAVGSSSPVKFRKAVKLRADQLVLLSALSHAFLLTHRSPKKGRGSTVIDSKARFYAVSTAGAPVYAIGYAVGFLLAYPEASYEQMLESSGCPKALKCGSNGARAAALRQAVESALRELRLPAFALVRGEASSE